MVFAHRNTNTEENLRSRYGLVYIRDKTAAITPKNNPRSNLGRNIFVAVIGYR